MGGVATNGTLDDRTVLPRRQARRTLKASMTFIATDGTRRIFIVLECAIQDGQFPQLLLFVHILFVIEDD